MSLPTKLTDTTQGHLQQLVDDAAPENQHRDYKRELPSNWDNEAKKRFVADLIAMANSTGGDVIYGIDEDSDACAKALVPQLHANGIDAEVRRMQDFAMEYVELRKSVQQVLATYRPDEQQQIFQRGQPGGERKLLPLSQSATGPVRPC